uniref:Uncharacterized protein n=1 Tax=Arundo donax TaxID=35708 RepID=A0A0A8XV97_ARUDO
MQHSSKIDIHGMPKKMEPYKRNQPCGTDGVMVEP